MASPVDSVTEGWKAASAGVAQVFEERMNRDVDFVAGYRLAEVAEGRVAGTVRLAAGRM